MQELWDHQVQVNLWDHQLSVSNYKSTTGGSFGSCVVEEMYVTVLNEDAVKPGWLLYSTASHRPQRKRLGGGRWPTSAVQPHANDSITQPSWFWGEVSRPLPLQGPTLTRTRRLTSRLSLRARTARPTRRSTVTWPAPQTQETSRWCSTPSPTSSSPTTCGAAACTEHARSPVHRPRLFLYPDPAL